MSLGSTFQGDLLALPSGGGAVKGLGETFAPDPHTGTGSFTVPLAIPTGRNGMEPQLSLVYSTGHPNGPLGLGWDLSVPSLSRRTARGVPVYDDERDVFVVSNAEDLVPVDAQHTTYRPRTEGLFSRIRHLRSGTTDHWEVDTTGGLHSVYGTPERAGDDPAAVANPDPALRREVFTWRLSRTEDLFGNRVEYDYERDATTAPERRWDQLYLRRIRYADDPAAGGQATFLVSVTFVYEERPDPFSDHRAGFEVRTRRRCTSITVATHVGQERVVRTYELTYLDELGRAPVNGVSLLGRIVVTGHDGAASESLPPLEFGYTSFEARGRRFQPLAERDLPARSLATAGLELVDVHGDGLPDLVQLDATAARYWRNRGDARFDPPRALRANLGGLTPAQSGVQLLDADGDGRADLLVSTGHLAGHIGLRDSERATPPARLRAYGRAPSLDLESPDVRLVDIDGDGVTDAVRSASRLEVSLSDPDQGWSSIRSIVRGASAAFPDVSFADPRVKWADMTGDGLQDVVLVHDGGVRYWPSRGRGRWGTRVTMRDSPRFPQGYDPGRILLGDVDGDGVADLIYVGDTSVTLWINRSGNGWGSPLVIPGTPPLSDRDAVRLVDLLGTGIAGVLWSSDGAPGRRGGMAFLDFTGGRKPYLLDEIGNSMGAVTRVAYAPSTRFTVADRRRGAPRRRTALPFPVQVVAQVEVVDEIGASKLTTEYCYHHPHWDGREREFRGFGRVDRLDTVSRARFNRSGLHPPGAAGLVGEDDFSPPVETRTWFHLGAVDDGGGPAPLDCGDEYWPEDPPGLATLPGAGPLPAGLSAQGRREALRALRGRVLRTEVYTRDGGPLDGRPVEVSETDHGVRAVAGAPGRVFFPYARARRVTRWERGEDPQTEVTFAADHDDVGQPRAHTTVSLPRRSACRRTVPLPDGTSATVDERRVLATHTRLRHAAADPAVHPGLYLRDRVAWMRSFELRAPPEVAETAPDDLPTVLAQQLLAADGVRRACHDTLDPWQPGDPIPAAVVLTGHTVHHYDGEAADAFSGLAPGRLGRYGALTRSEALVFTEADLGAGYGARRPTYLGGAAGLPAGAPAGFGAALGYRRVPADTPDHHAGVYADTARRRFDFQEATVRHRRGVLVGLQDPLGHLTTVEPDAHWLLPARIVDPVGLETAVDHDERLLRPRRVTDANGGTTSYRYTPLGLLARVFAQDAAGRGATEAKPDVEYAHDLGAWARTRDTASPQPPFVHHRHRVWRATDAVSDEALEVREYSDGFGRLLQTRTRAEDVGFGATGEDVWPATIPARVTGQVVADRVAVSGWAVYDNKGRPVRRYEPFFSTGWDYQPEADARRGAPVVTRYDALGRVVRTIRPDGAEQRVLFGAPAQLATPGAVLPSPWEIWTYDPNDLAPDSRDPLDPSSTLAALAPAAHHHTPTGTVHDARGRPRCHLQHTGPGAGAVLVTRFEHDLMGNLRSVTDPLGRVAARFVHDRANRLLRVDSIDAGTRTFVRDASDRAVETRDGLGRVVLRTYDLAGRPLRVLAQDDPADPLTVREQLRYGDEEDRAAARAVNALGRVVEHLDEAGMLRTPRFDLAGNALAQTRQVIADTALRAGWRPDWGAAGAASALGPAYTTTTRYDALGRPVEITYPDCVTGGPPVVTARYNRAGALQRLDLDGAPVVAHLAYNARGQRILAAWGNGVWSRYAYDPRSALLRRLRSERSVEGPGATGLTWTAIGDALQDLAYDYDLAGNLTSVTERTPGCGTGATPDELERTFAYDPLYRLTLATGRACATAGCGFFSPPPVGAPPWPSQADAPQRTLPLSETFTYDDAGNLERVERELDGTTTVRAFGYGGQGNRLGSVTEGGTPLTVAHDDNGNLRAEGAEREYRWDHADRLIGFTERTGGAPVVEERHLYDAGGALVKTWVRRGGSGDGETTARMAGVFEHEVGPTERNRLHLSDGHRRIAVVRRGPAGPRDAGPAVQYHLADHLGTSAVVCDAAAGWVNREEHTAYGETGYGGFAGKRAGFTGRDRDEDSGLQRHGARWYSPRLARWLSCDPQGTLDGLNLYAYAHGNPLRFVDPSGEQGEPAQRPDLSEAANQVMAAKRDAFLQAIKSTGVGTYAGSHSPWAVFSGSHVWQQEVMEYLAQRTPGPPANPRITNCIEWPLEILGEAFPQAGLNDWAAIEAEVRRSRGTTPQPVESGRASVLARALHERGWTTVYWNRDTATTVDYGIPFATVAKRGYYPAVRPGQRTVSGEDAKPLDITVPIDDQAINFDPTKGSKTKAVHKGAIEKLLAVPFAIGLARSGHHTFLLSRGKVWEVHWSNQPSDPKLIEISTFAEFARTWKSGVIVVPPGVWQGGAAKPGPAR